jgi:hypothetical protein
MYSKRTDALDQMLARLESPDWGIWGKEKYTFNEEKLHEKHQEEISRVRKLRKEIPDRLLLALRYSYGICGLDAYSLPITEDEFDYLCGIYNEASVYINSISDDGFAALVKEFYCIHKTASLIPGFTNGQLVNETDDPKIWRKYIYLDFFKFSFINILMRESVEDLVGYNDAELTSKLILAYFLGTGSLIEKISAFFSEECFAYIIERTKEICKKVEINPEFPDIQYNNYADNYSALKDYIGKQRKILSSEGKQRFSAKRYEPFDVCNKYYYNYYSIPYEEQAINKPLKTLVHLYQSLLDSYIPEGKEPLSHLKNIMAEAEKKYYTDALSADCLTIENFYAQTTHPYFQALLYEGKILSLLYQQSNPKAYRYYHSLFSELVPFYALRFKKNGKLFAVNTAVPDDLPRLTLAHHIHNANCEKLYDKMAINKLHIWDNDKISFNISSSSSNTEKVLKEREYCLELGFNHYRIHARQHLKAGNQNRAIPNALDGVNQEYYLTLDDDYFVFPDFALEGHTEIKRLNLDYVQSPLAFRGIFDHVTHAEQVDAESMLFFEATYGRNYPRNYVFPRGTGTIFSFTNGQSSLSDTGGFLVDFSCEDFGQGYISLIQQNSEIFGKGKCTHAPGQMTENIHVIGEGVDLNGKIRQVERWMQGAGKIFFHLLIPTLFKSLAKGETSLLLNRQFVSTFCLTASGITFRFMLFSFLCLPFLFSTLSNNKIYTPQVQNHYLLTSLIILNFSAIFAMFFHIQQKNSFSSALRLILIEQLITISAIIGYLKGLFGITPASWSANKTKKFVNNSFVGIYILIFMNVFAIITLNSFGFWFYFWAMFNLFLIIGGLLLFNRKYLPKDAFFRQFKKPSFEMWIILFVISIIVNVIFFIAEFNSSKNIIKIVLLSLMVFNFYISFRMMFLNVILVYKLRIKKKTHNLY